MKPLSLQNEEVRKGWLFLAPCLAMLAFVVVYPLAYGIYLSFTNLSLGFKDVKFVGLDNYYRLFSGDRIFNHAVRATAIWTLGVVFFQYIIGLGAALLLNEPFRGRWIYRGLILLPWVVPDVVGTYMWQWLYDPNYGQVNWFLMNIGLMSSKRALLANPDTALYAVMVIMIWRGIPFMSVVLLAGLQAIPRELYEVASMDGANIFQRFRNITFPLLKNVTVVCYLLMTIWMFNHFSVPYVLSQGGPAYRTTLLAVYTYMRGLVHHKIGQAAAIGVFMLMILLVFAFFYVRIVVKEKRS